MTTGTPGTRGPRGSAPATRGPRGRRAGPKKQEQRPKTETTAATTPQMQPVSRFSHEASDDEAKRMLESLMAGFNIEGEPDKTESESDDKDDDDDVSLSPQQRTHETPFYREPDPDTSKQLRRLERMLLSVGSKAASLRAAAAKPVDDSDAPAPVYDFSAGFSDIHLDLAVEVIGGACNLNTPQASVSIAISEIKVAPGSALADAASSSDTAATAETDGGDPDDDEPLGLKCRAVVFMMWCHATRLAHPLCFFVYNEVKPALVAGRISKVVGELEAKGFSVVSWFSDCTPVYHKIADLVSAANPSLTWLPDPLSVMKGLRDAFADPCIALELPSGGIAGPGCVADMAHFISREPCLAPLYNITGNHIDVKGDRDLGMFFKIDAIKTSIANRLLLMFFEPIHAVKNNPKLDKATRNRLLDSLLPVEATGCFMSDVIKYRDSFMSRAKIANLNHSLIADLDEVAEYFMAWKEFADQRAAQGTASLAYSFVPIHTYTALIESIAAFKSVARRLLHVGITPVAPVAFGNSFLKKFLKDVRAAAGVPDRNDPGVIAEKQAMKQFRPNLCAAQSAADRPRVHVKHLQDTAIKAHQHNAKLLRAAAKKRRAVTHYDGTDAHQSILNMFACTELKIGAKDDDESSDEEVEQKPEWRGVNPFCSYGGGFTC
ncbi:hypothetical protein H9P43_002455 [Blastocladiella emersonii ATCC 22665]|nr:hypothetical protein H9P43_002455 [Blastocladiella emersonii ATCC 22665]